MGDLRIAAKRVHIDRGFAIASRLRERRLVLRRILPCLQRLHERNLGDETGLGCEEAECSLIQLDRGEGVRSLR